MPHRIAAAVEPLARLHAREMAGAFEALCAHACEMTGISSVLVAQGVPPGMAHVLAKQWHAAGLTIAPEVRAAAALPGIYAAPGLYAAPGIAGMPVTALAAPWMPGIAAAPWMAPLVGVTGMPGIAGITAGLAPRLGLAGLLVDPD